MIDFCDTEIGRNLSDKIQMLLREHYELEQELRFLEKDIDAAEMEYDMLEEMYNESSYRDDDDRE